MVKVRQYRRRGKPSGFWEVDVRLTLPSGVAYRERVRVPVTGRTNARRWAEAREAEVLALARQGLDAEAIRARLQGKEVEEEQKTIPTLAEFKSRFFEGHVKANRLKPSSAETYEILFKTHLEPVFGSLGLDTIGDELVQRFKGELVEDELANKSINNILTALSVMLKRAVEWKVIEAMPCRIRLLKVDRPELAFYDFGEYRRLVDAAVAIDPRIELLALLGGDAGLGTQGRRVGSSTTDRKPKAWRRAWRRYPLPRRRAEATAS